MRSPLSERCPTTTALERTIVPMDDADRMPPLGAVKPLCGQRREIFVAVCSPLESGTSAAAGDGASRADGLQRGAILERVGRPLQCGILDGLRTGMGQIRSFGDVCSMSGLHPKAAVERTSVDVAKCHERTVT
jgi:hypothetical protein